MLTQKFKDFIEETALKIRSELKNTIYPNKYDYSELLNWLENNGAVIFCGEENHTEGDIITLKSLSNSDDNNQEKVKSLLHEMWYFIYNTLWLKQDSESIQEDAINTCDQYPRIDISIFIREISANYFVRAMLFPEEFFIKSVMNNVNQDGSCNIHIVAKEFSEKYQTVLARGKDLNIWRWNE